MVNSKTIVTMKNLFKSLMLVAVAAMAFTACQKDNGEVNAVAKKTVITGVAVIDADDTRSGFVGSDTIENGDGTTTTVYKSAWVGGENIKLFAGDLVTTAIIDAEGKFTAQFDGELPETFFMTVCSPAASWESREGQYICNIPQVQTPSANSVDPAAHILQAQNVMVSGGTADYIKMEHQVAYGKMTVNTPAEFVIDHVVIELNGAWYGYDKSLSYTINAKNVENNTFWFATDGIEVANFTVTAYDAEGNAYTKSVIVPEDGLLFQYGRVSTFSVSNLKVYEEPAGPMFTSAETSSYGQDKYIFFYSDDNTLSDLKVNAYGCFSGDNEDIWNVGTYTQEMVDGSMIYTGSYTTYGKTRTGSITVTVSHVKEGYKVVIENVTDENGNIILEKAIYVGPISGLAMPDLRTQLEMPDVNSSISGKTITLSWEAIENAESYLIVCTSSNDIEPISTTETTATITVPSYDYYSFYVQAVVSEDSATYRSSAKAYVEYNDPREYLPLPTNVAATVDGANVTISWEAVEGADGYRVSYYLNGQNDIVVKDTSYTFYAGFNVTLYVYVFSVADDDSPTYRSSSPYDYNAYAVVNTDKDPNVLADIIATSIAWDDLGYFVMKGEVVSGTAWGHSSDYIRLYLNEADRLGNNSINVGHYTGCSTSTPSEDEFGARFCLYWGSVTYPSAFGSASTLDVDYDETTGYKIVITHDGVSYGYQGKPDGWVAPGGSGNDEPENPGDGGETTDPETSGSMKYIMNYGSGYSNLRYYEYTDGNDTIGVWFNSTTTDVTQLFDGTYNNVTNGMSGIAANTKKVYVEKFDINGENIGGVQLSSTITVQESGKKIDFKIDYNSSGTILTKNYSFVGTITQ